MGCKDRNLFPGLGHDPYDQCHDGYHQDKRPPHAGFKNSTDGFTAAKKGNCGKQKRVKKIPGHTIKFKCLG